MLFKRFRYIRAINDWLVVTRFANEGFNIKPYNSKYACHAVPFIDKCVDCEIDVAQEVEPDIIIKPEYNSDVNQGFFAFLDSYRPNWHEVLRKRKNHKKNVALIHKMNYVWARNINENNKQYVAYKRRYSNHPDTDIPTCFTDPLSDFCWVKMRAFDVVIRNKKRQESYSNAESNDPPPIPEKFSEIYVTEDIFNKMIVISIPELFALKILLYIKLYWEDRIKSPLSKLIKKVINYETTK